MNPDAWGVLECLYLSLPRMDISAVHSIFACGGEDMVSVLSVVFGRRRVEVFSLAKVLLSFFLARKNRFFLGICVQRLPFQCCWFLQHPAQDI